MINDGFDLVRQLPGGRHGAIWQATVSSSGRSVALKQLFGVENAAAELVRHQAEQLRQLSDPRLVGTHDPVADADGLWLVEDWIEGTSLAAISAGSIGLTAAQTMGVVHGVLLGLSKAHRAGIVHGELSPRSVMITTEGQPVVIGFVAHAAGRGVADTDGFASPEAKSGNPHLDARTDVFSVAAMVTDLLAQAGIPAELEPVLNRARAEEPAERHADASALLADLTSAAERAYGAGWWTTAGLGGVVASTLAATAAGTAGTTAATTTAATTTGSAGAVSGTMSAGDSALAGGTRLAHGGSGAIKTGALARRPAVLIIAGVAVALVAVIVGAVALLRPGNTTTAEAGSGSNTNTNTNTNTNQGGGKAAPSASRTTGPTDPQQPGSSASKPADPSRTPSAAQPAATTFRVVDTVSKSTDPKWPVGKSSSLTWTVTESAGSIKLAGKGYTYTLKRSGGAYVLRQSGKNSCWKEVDGKETDRDTVTVEISFSVNVADGALTGSSTVAEARRCKYAKKAYLVVRSFTGTKIK